MAVLSSCQSTRLQVYLAWVESWLHISTNEDQKKEARCLTIDDIALLFQDSNIKRLLDPTRLRHVVASFQQRFNQGEITIGGELPPSCAATNLISEKYDPRVDCTCDGISPMSAVKNTDLNKAGTCRAIEKMFLAEKDVIERPKEWNGHGLFTVGRLKAAVKELTLCNFEIQPSPNICSGADISSIPPIKAPDRRPDPQCDTAPEVYDALFPTLEKVKLCADAKYFHPIACGGTLVDEGILRAIADAGNDVMIGDYCEAATEETLSLLQKNGAAALAFLKACNLAAIVSDWQLDILVAAHIQFRVLGYFRNHAIPKLPGGLYGSRMTDLIAHRHIDIANAVGVVAASLATGQQISETEYMKLSYGTTLINDLVDFRSDAMRKQRENPVLRGIRGPVCQYLHKQILDCIIFTRELIESKQLLAMVTMAFCNWTVMASHHKLYELVHGACENKEIPECSYGALEEEYARLIMALEAYGSLGSDGPRWTMKRMELDRLYGINRRSAKTHLAWMADMVRLLLNPSDFRRIVDVVHYSWAGDIGDVEYCP